MTPEEKELLLKDLCARLPYGVMVYDNSHRNYGKSKLINIGIDGSMLVDNENNDIQYYPIISEVKPYLRPMSSMTKEEIDEYHKRCEFNDCDYSGEPMYFDTIDSFDYLYSIHVDCRGLIPKSLALEAPERMYKV